MSQGKERDTTELFTWEQWIVTSDKFGEEIHRDAFLILTNDGSVYFVMDYKQMNDWSFISHTLEEELPLSDWLLNITHGIFHLLVDVKRAHCAICYAISGQVVLKSK